MTKATTSEAQFNKTVKYLIDSPVALRKSWPFKLRLVYSVNAPCLQNRKETRALHDSFQVTGFVRRRQFRSQSSIMSKREYLMLRFVSVRCFGFISVWVNREKL